MSRKTYITERSKFHIFNMKNVEKSCNYDEKIMKKAKGYLLTGICQYSLIGMLQTHPIKISRFFAQRPLLLLLRHDATRCNGTCVLNLSVMINHEFISIKLCLEITFKSLLTYCIFVVSIQF